MSNQWRSQMSYIQSEPVRFWSAVTTIIAAVIALLQVFGAIDWTADQVAAVMGVVAASGGLIQFFLVRDQVSPGA